MTSHMAAIPANNEAKTVIRVTWRAGDYLPILMVDDGLTGDTA